MPYDLCEYIFTCVVLESQRYFGVMWGRMDGDGFDMQHPSLCNAYCTLRHLCKYHQSFFEELIRVDLKTQNCQIS